MIGDGTGHSYERRAIQAWLQNHDTSPITGALLSSKTRVPNHALRNLIEGMKKLEDT